MTTNVWMKQASLTLKRLFKKATFIVLLLWTQLPTYIGIRRIQSGFDIVW